MFCGDRHASNALPQRTALLPGTQQSLWLALAVLGAFIPWTAKGQCNQAPIAANDNASSCGLPALIDALGNDWDPDGEVLRVVLGSHDCSGTVTVSYDMLELIPDSGWTTSCTISYQAVDESGMSDSAVVAVTAVPCVQIFADGFETGDTSQWDAVEGGA